MADNARIRSITGPFGRERMIIRECRDRSTMWKFLNTGSNAIHWREYDGPLPKGTYAFAGGEWHNVKALDKFVLAHI